MSDKQEFMEVYEQQVFKKWQASRQWYPDIGKVVDYLDPWPGQTGYVYGDMSYIETYYKEVDEGESEYYVVTIGNIIQEFPDLQKAEEYLWKWHAKDNCCDRYENLSHLSTIEEVK